MTKTEKLNAILTRTGEINAEIDVLLETLNKLPPTAVLWMRRLEGRADDLTAELADLQERLDVLQPKRSA